MRGRDTIRKSTGRAHIVYEGTTGFSVAAHHIPGKPTMKKQLLAFAIVSAAGLALAGSAQAADGTISITGQVQAQTCTINGGGNIDVSLPTVSVSALSSAGNTAGETPFQIQLTGCSSGMGTATTYFEPGPTIDTTTGYLKPSGASPAGNVEIQLLNSGGTAMALNASTAASQGADLVDASSGAATLDYAARYIAVDGGASAGSANTSVTFTMVYN